MKEFPVLAPGFPESHALAALGKVKAQDIVKYPLIGVDPNDPHGRIMTTLFANSGLQYEVTIRARFGSTVSALVGQGLGIAIVDEFTLAAGQWPKTRALDIVEPTMFETFIAYRKDNVPSSYGARFVAALRQQMAALSATGPRRGTARTR